MRLLFGEILASSPPDVTASKITFCAISILALGFSRLMGLERCHVARALLFDCWKPSQQIAYQRTDQVACSSAFPSFCH